MSPILPAACQEVRNQQSENFVVFTTHEEGSTLKMKIEKQGTGSIKEWKGFLLESDDTLKFVFGRLKPPQSSTTTPPPPGGYLFLLTWVGKNVPDATKRKFVEVDQAEVKKLTGEVDYEFLCCSSQDLQDLENGKESSEQLERELVVNSEDEELKEEEMTEMAAEVLGDEMDSELQTQPEVTVEFNDSEDQLFRDKLNANLGKKGFQILPKTNWAAAGHKMAGTFKVLYRKCSLEEAKQIAAECAMVLRGATGEKWLSETLVHTRAFVNDGVQGVKEKVVKIFVQRKDYASWRKLLLHQVGNGKKNQYFGNVWNTEIIRKAFGWEKAAAGEIPDLVNVGIRNQANLNEFNQMIKKLQVASTKDIGPGYWAKTKRIMKGNKGAIAVTVLSLGLDAAFLFMSYELDGKRGVEFGMEVTKVVLNYAGQAVGALVGALFSCPSAGAFVGGLVGTAIGELAGWLVSVFSSPSNCHGPYGKLPSDYHQGYLLEFQKGFDLGVSKGFDLEASKGYDLKVSRGYDLKASHGFDLEASKGYDLKASKGYDLKASKGYDLEASKGFDLKASKGFDLKAGKGTDLRTSNGFKL